MKLGTHRDEFADAIGTADVSWVLQPEGLTWDLAATLARVPSSRVRGDTASIVAEVASECRPGDAVLVMSNGGFQNIRADLKEALSARSG